MQIICLIVGLLAIRNVKRQKVVSASLFDQRRMRIQNSAVANGGSSNGSGSASRSNVKYSSLQSKNSMETIELTRTKIGAGGKVPKSPAPEPSNVETV